MQVALITSRDPKGRQAIDTCSAAYDSMKLTADEAQLVNERGGELRAGVRALLGRLSVRGKVFDLTTQIEALINLGYHTAHGTRHTACGMSAEAYRALWPSTVVQPALYAGRLDLPLLVDTTIPLDQLAARNSNVLVCAAFASCKDIVSAPRHESGAVCTRYVAWIQVNRWLDRKVADVRNEMPKDEVGLVSVEGLHLPGQYASVLRKQAVDLPGSRCDQSSAPYVHWFGNDRPLFGAIGVGFADPLCGSGSRGTTVVPVTW